MEIKKIVGDISYDDRGSVLFVNDFNFKGIKRFYVLQNDKNNFIRAWHAHKNEAKFFWCCEGKFKISLVKIDNFSNPSKKLKVNNFILSSLRSEILFVPKGYANGTMNLQKNSKLVVFSNKNLNESLSDDYRYDFDYWNPWNIKYR